ncbi:MAG: 5'/3'-nucleotidase SurE [Ilumatobacteraceae bacterium]
MVGSIAAAGTSAEAGPVGPEPLRILLTNDDGWAAPGIEAVFDALVADGHDVTMVAPLTNQSGASARVTFGGTLSVVRQEEHKFSVAGTPADATEFGLSVVYAESPPDLVISGTNAGQNIAAATIHSGTVGAAVTGLVDGVPAIAVSTEIDFATGSGPYAQTADFVVELVDTLQARARRGHLLPDGVGLNVNYPLVDDPDGVPEGVALTATGRGFLDVTYGAVSLPELGETALFPVQVSTAVAETVADSDSVALAEDKIAISVIEGDYDADRNAYQEVRRIVQYLD